MVLQRKMKTNLKKFKDIIDVQYPSLKKYIISESERYIIMEDQDGDCVFGTNKDFDPLFEFPCSLPVKSVNVSFKEKDCYYIIQIELQ